MPALPFFISSLHPPNLRHLRLPSPFPSPIRVHPCNPWFQNPHFLNHRCPRMGTDKLPTPQQLSPKGRLHEKSVDPPHSADSARPTSPSPFHHRRHLRHLRLTHLPFSHHPRNLRIT
jgi:hypothetical protein